MSNQGTGFAGLVDARAETLRQQSANAQGMIQSEHCALLSRRLGPRSKEVEVEVVAVSAAACRRRDCPCHDDLENDDAAGLREKERVWLGDLEAGHGSGEPGWPCTGSLPRAENLSERATRHYFRWSEVGSGSTEEHD